MEGQEILIDIEKSKDNFNKDRKPRCFNCNIFGHIAKECWRPRKEIKKCYKCNKTEYLAKNYRSGQKMKNRSVQEESDKENDDKQESFVGGSE